VPHAHLGMSAAATYCERLTCFLGGGYNYDSTSVRLSFDCDSITLRPFDVMSHDHMPTCRGAAASRPK